MKKTFILLFFVLAIFSTTHAQEFDYQINPYEIGIDIIPILGGNYPYSLFFRKNHQMSSGKNRAWRGVISGSNDNLYSNFPIHDNYDRVPIII